MEKKVVYGFVERALPFIFSSSKIISGIEFDGDVIQNISTSLEDAKKIKILGSNLLYAEDYEHKYYIFFNVRWNVGNKILAISEEIPKIGVELLCKYYYIVNSYFYEKKKWTTPVKKVKYLGDDLYRIRSKHTYYVKVVKELQDEI